MATSAQPPQQRSGEEPPGGWQQAMPVSPEDNPYAIKYPAGRVWLFSVLSFGLYTFYWFYKTRKLLDGEYGDRDDAVFHTVGLIVPVLNWIVTYWLWRDLNDLRLRHGLPEFSVPGYLAGGIALGLVALTPIVYTLALFRTNEYWDARTGGLAVDSPIRTEEKIVVGVGIGLWLLFILMFVLIIVIAIVAGSSS